MRRLNKTYPYQKPSKNRSSKDLNLIVMNYPFPEYLGWSNENLAKYAAKCKNPNNCYQQTLDARKKAHANKLARKAALKNKNS